MDTDLTTIRAEGVVGDGRETDLIASGHINVIIVLACGMNAELPLILQQSVSSHPEFEMKYIRARRFDQHLRYRYRNDSPAHLLSRLPKLDMSEV
jgi:hypothetical protein